MIDDVNGMWCQQGLSFKFGYIVTCLACKPLMICQFLIWNARCCTLCTLCLCHTERQNSHLHSCLLCCHIILHFQV